MKLLLYICVCLLGYASAKQALHPHKRADADESSSAAPSANGTSPAAVESTTAPLPIPVTTQNTTTGRPGGIFGSVIKIVPCFFINSADKIIEGLENLGKAFGINKRDMEKQKRSCLEQQRKKEQMANRRHHAKKHE